MSAKRPTDERLAEIRKDYSSWRRINPWSHHAFKDLFADRDALAAENERLRAAIDEIYEIQRASDFRDEDKPNETTEDRYGAALDKIEAVCSREKS